MSAMGPNDQLEVARVEQFLAPLAEVAPASRANGRRRARARVRRFVILAVVLAALGAGIAIAAESEPTVTITESTGGTVTTEESPVIPVPAPGADDCGDLPSCSAPGHAGHDPRQPGGHR